MNSIPNIALFDLGLALLYLFIIYLLIWYWQKKKNSKVEYRLLLVGLTAKVLGSFVFVIISIYYYQAGDTFLYFQIAEDLRRNLFLNYSETIETLFTSYHDLVNVSFNPLDKYNYYYERETNWVFGRIVFFFNMISFGSYLVSSILMSVTSFIGLWLGFRSICRLYPRVSIRMMIPFFLIPTALIWSSGILKDTLVIGSIGILLHAFSYTFILKERFWLNISLIFFGMLILQLLKPILLIVLLPCLFFWGILHVTKPIQSTLFRLIIRFSFALVVLGFAYLLDQKVVDPSSKYKTENLLKTINGFQSFHSLDVFSKGKNVYTLDGYTSTSLDVIAKIPQAINVTYFRPYIWEINNWPMFLGAIESLLLVLILVFTIYTSKKYFIKTLVKNTEVNFMVLFSIFYAIVVGITSYNFGALSRYKIPSIMFIYMALIIIYECNNSQKKLPYKSKNDV